MDLMSPSKISASQIEVLAHHTELDIVSAQNVAELSHSFLWAYIRTSVAGAVVSRQQQLEFLAWLPAFAFAQDPCGFGALYVAADPSLKNVVHHAADPPTFAGQPWYG